MLRLREQPDDLAALVDQASRALGIPPVFVEKDFWVTEVLRAVAQPVDGVVAIFKGGTSLSKAYGLIERFSEDVDILIVVEDTTWSKPRVHKALKLICAGVAEHLGVPEDRDSVRSETGIHRDVRYLCPMRTTSPDVSEGVLLEMGRRGGDLPRHRRQLGSLVAEHAVGSGLARPDEFEEFATFEIDVLATERTLVEKLSLLHRLAVTEDRDGLLRAGRHIYDIFNLLAHDETVRALGGDHAVAAAIAEDADHHSRLWNRAFQPRPTDGFAASPAFEESALAFEHLREGYSAAEGLIYGDVPSFEVCIDAVHAARHVL